MTAGCHVTTAKEFHEDSYFQPHKTSLLLPFRHPSTREPHPIEALPPAGRFIKSQNCAAGNLVSNPGYLYLL